MPTDKQFYLDALWRGARTVAQTLAGMLVVVQTSNVMPSTEPISVPWWSYVYASLIAGLVSVLQSIDRERAVGNVLAAEPVPTPQTVETTVTPMMPTADLR